VQYARPFAPERREGDARVLLDRREEVARALELDRRPSHRPRQEERALPRDPRAIAQEIAALDRVRVDRTFRLIEAALRVVVPILVGLDARVEERELDRGVARLARDAAARALDPPRTRVHLAAAVVRRRRPSSTTRPTWSLRRQKNIARTRCASARRVRRFRHARKRCYGTVASQRSVLPLTR
jgi:hypothetical protein